MNFIEKSLISKDYKTSLELCLNSNNYYLGKIISYIYNIPEYFNVQKETQIKIKILCSWCDSPCIHKLWSKMLPIYSNLILTQQDPDYYIVINSTVEVIPKNKTILFRMEPNMKINKFWGDWSDPNSQEFLKIYDHQSSYNNIEWHLSLTHFQLCNIDIKKTKIISTILSDKYNDPGQKKRIDFVKYLENFLDIDVFGNNKYKYKNFQGSLPYHQKDDSVFPYKYTFNVENNSIKNYFTEKLIDGILGECLVFYSGCPNIKEYFDERSFIYLELIDFEKDAQTILKAISEDWYSKRLKYIKQTKMKILENMNCFQRVEDYLKTINSK
jgi:hypothetical protein